MKPANVAAETEDDEIDLAALMATLWSGKGWIGGASGLAMAMAAGYLLVTPPTYQADALLQLEAGQSLALPESMSDLLGTNAPSTLAELEILRSRQVLGRAVAELNLAWLSEPVLTPFFGQAALRLGGDGADKPKLVLGYLEVPTDWLDREMVLTMLDGDKYSITLVDGTVVDGVAGQLATRPLAGFALNVRSLTGEPGQSFRVMHRSELAAIKTLSEAVSAAERGRQSGIIEVKLKDGDPVAARDQLNAVIRAYTEQNISKSAAEAQKSLDFVSSQLPVAQAALAEAEKALNDYRAAQNSVDLEFETQSLLTETTGIEGQLRELKLREEELKQKYTSNHPVYRQLLEERDALLERLEELQSGITDLPETQREVINLTRNLELSQAAYFELMNRAQELRVLSASQIGSVRIIDDAATQVVPVAPKSSQVMALAALIGLIAGAGTVLARNWLRRGINGVQEIERLGVPVFATINLYGSAKTRLANSLLVARDDPDDVVVEAFRSLRTSLHFGMLDNANKSIVMTSSAPGAGKSFVSANLAVVAAKAGQRVCLIDADMRRGTQRKFFGLQKKLIGLADFLAGDAGLDDVLRVSGIDNLSLIATGAFPPNPSELLMRNRLAELIATLDSHFDLVIFDAPPTLAVTDAVVIARQAGSVIAVARHDVTPLGELEAVQKTMSNAGVTLRGAVLNAYDPRRAKAGTQRYGYGYSNRYAYGRGGAEG